MRLIMLDLIFVADRKEIPFDIRIPNKVTLKTFQDTQKGKRLKRYKTHADLFEDLGI